MAMLDGVISEEVFKVGHMKPFHAPQMQPPTEHTIPPPVRHRSLLQHRNHYRPHTYRHSLAPQPQVRSRRLPPLLRPDLFHRLNHPSLRPPPNNLSLRQPLHPKSHRRQTTNPQGHRRLVPRTLSRLLHSSLDSHLRRQVRLPRLLQTVGKQSRLDIHLLEDRRGHQLRIMDLLRRRRLHRLHTHRYLRHQMRAAATPLPRHRPHRLGNCSGHRDGDHDRRHPHLDPARLPP